MKAIDTSNSTRGGLSARESRLLSRLASRGTEIVTIDDVQHALELPRASAREVASRLVEKGWFDRLFTGRYLIVPLAAGERPAYTTHEYLVAEHVADPMYVGYYTALDHHGLTEQVPRTVYVVSPERAPDREVHGVLYRVVTVTDRKFFGHEPAQVDGATVPVANLEKTLVDCADHPERCGGIRELATAMVTAEDRDCSWETVGEYLDRLGNGAATKRVVYLADLLGIDLPAREALVEGFTAGYSPLDPTRSEKGRYDSQYRLRINVEPETLGPTES